jgi:hypothetical protein
MVEPILSVQLGFSNSATDPCVSEAFRRFLCDSVEQQCVLQINSLLLRTDFFTVGHCDSTIGHVTAVTSQHFDQSLEAVLSSMANVTQMFDNFQSRLRFVNFIFFQLVVGRQKSISGHVPLTGSLLAADYSAAGGTRRGRNDDQQL